MGKMKIKKGKGKGKVLIDDSVLGDKQKAKIEGVAARTRSRREVFLYSYEKTWADREYSRKRNELIPEAERFAFARAGEKPRGTTRITAWSDVWNRAFFTKMDELARARGLLPKKKGGPKLLTYEEANLHRTRIFLG